MPVSSQPASRALGPFWYRWLALWCLGVFVFGLLLAGVVSDTTAGPIKALIAVLHPGDNSLTDSFRFGLGLQGALTMGWAVTMWGLMQVSAHAGPHSTVGWRWLTAGLLFWYGIDSAISIATGFGLNAVSNTLLITLFLIPVLASGVLKDA